MDTEDVGLTYTDRYLETLADLLNIKVEDGRLVDEDGSPLGGDLQDAIQQMVVRGWETSRIRQKLYNSDMNEGRKFTLIHTLNLVERLINMEIRSTAFKPEEFMDVADRIVANVRGLYGE